MGGSTRCCWAARTTHSCGLSSSAGLVPASPSSTRPSPARWPRRTSWTRLAHAAPPIRTSGWLAAATASRRPGTWRPSARSRSVCSARASHSLRRPRWPSTRLCGMTRSASRLGMGILVGGLLAMGATVAQREIMRRAGTRLIDWEAVRGIARRRLGADDVQLGAEARQAAEEFYRAVLLRIEPVVAAEIGAALPQALETPAVIDRREWIDLNL